MNSAKTATRRAASTSSDLEKEILKNFSGAEVQDLLDHAADRLNDSSDGLRALIGALPTETILRRLHNRHRDAPALIFGNGWRLAKMISWEARDGVITVGTNFSTRVVDSRYLAYIDASSRPPAGYRGIAFGLRDVEAPAHHVLGAYETPYWAAHGRLVPTLSYTGMYAIEIAAFLGCSPLYLVGFDGDNSPTGARHFAGRPQGGALVGRGFADSHNRWIRDARKRLAEIRPGTRIFGVDFGGRQPAIDAVDGFIKADDCSALQPRRAGGSRP